MGESEVKRKVKDKGRYRLVKENVSPMDI